MSNFSSRTHSYCFIASLSLVYQQRDDRKQTQKKLISTYLALKHRFIVSCSVDVITLRLKAPLPGIKRAFIDTAIQVQIKLSVGTTKDEPLKLLFTQLTKQQYVLLWADESVVNGSTGGFSTLRSYLRLDEKLRNEKKHLLEEDFRMLFLSTLCKEIMSFNHCVGIVNQNAHNRNIPLISYESASVQKPQVAKTVME